jgi:hypothetical protein
MGPVWALRAKMPAKNGRQKTGGQKWPTKNVGKNMPT